MAWEKRGNPGPERAGPENRSGQCPKTGQGAVHGLQVVDGKADKRGGAGIDRGSRKRKREAFFGTF